MDILDGNLYVRSSATIMMSDTVVIYKPDVDQWYNQCNAPSKQKKFALAVVNNQLVLAGGIDTSQSVNWWEDMSSKVAVWNPTSKNWEYPYPPMPTARHSAQLIGYLHYLIAVGGSTKQSEDSLGSDTVTNVEILDTSRSQWYIAESLPKSCYIKQSVIVLDTLYLLGSSSMYYSSSFLTRASLPALVSLATSKRASASTWEVLPKIPFVCSGLVAYESSLLAIGYFKSESTIISGIYVYSTDTNEWNNIGDLPTALEVAMCAVLPSKEFLVVTNHDEVYIGTPGSLQLEN